MIFLYILVGFIGLLLLIIIISLIGQKISDILTMKTISKELNHLMEVHYNGNFKDIVRNMDMFCGYYDYIDRNFVQRNNYSEDINLDICFELKDKKMNKEKICYNYLKINELDKIKLDKFLESNYNISIKII